MVTVRGVPRQPPRARIEFSELVMEHTHRARAVRSAPRLSARARDRDGPLAGPIIVTCVQAISFIIGKVCWSNVIGNE